MNENKCIFCGKEDSPYTCPRCNGRYCSANCYKHEKHIRCTEDFYRDWVTVCCKDGANSPETKKKMVSCLKKLNEQDDNELDSDDDDVLELEDRMASVDLSEDVDTNVLWERLTEAEKLEFDEKVKSGEARNWIEIWEPWWQQKESITFVEEVNVDKPKPETKKRRPQIKENIRPLSALTSRPPADCLKNNLLNALTSYVLTVRFYNGDHFEFAHEATKLLLDLSSYLLESRNFGNVGEAIVMAFQQEIQNGKNCVISPCHSKLNVMGDLIEILNGPNERNPGYYVLAAITDMMNLVQAATHQMKKEICKKKSTAKKYILVEKKLEYLLGWSVENVNTLKEMSYDITLEKANVTENELSLRAIETDSEELVKQNKKVVHVVEL